MPVRAYSHNAYAVMQARLPRKLIVRQNTSRYTEETILQRDNPVRKYPNWRNCFDASNVSCNSGLHTENDRQEPFD
ncbi:hypothetical protein BN2475_130066 [Paraburkholderia ribeironis]|uniref:Uncharacterized protein n=1 Tax=Paraburkholderia ribeironis TaxID=1247936 RepID=A0A1N7RTN6_9BURK|nr:hypothetical protein BN2475_130066 [Paraburkholderia ribeironis]